MGDVPKLDLDVNKQYAFWHGKKQRNSYITFLGLADSVAFMKSTPCLSSDTLTIVDNLGLTDTQCRDHTQIVNVLKRYIKGSHATVE